MLQLIYHLPLQLHPLLQSCQQMWTLSSKALPLQLLQQEPLPERQENRVVPRFQALEGSRAVRGYRSCGSVVSRWLLVRTVVVFFLVLNGFYHE